MIEAFLLMLSDESKKCGSCKESKRRRGACKDRKQIFVENLRSRIPITLHCSEQTRFPESGRIF